MENKKSLIITSTIIIVVLAVFIGVRLINTTNSQNVNLIENQTIENAKEEINNLADDGIINNNQNKKEEETLEEDKGKEGMVQEKNDDKLVEENKQEEERKSEKDSAKEEVNLKEIYVFKDKYVVREKETLNNIVDKCLSVNGLDAENKIYSDHAKELIITINKIEDPNIIGVGSELMIPTHKNFEGIVPDGEPYTVQPKDTLFNIVSEKMTWCEDVTKGVEILRINNNMEDYQVKAGMTIYIPAEEDVEV